MDYQLLDFGNGRKLERFGKFILDPAYRAIIVAAVMAILSPIMAEIGRHAAINERNDSDD